MAAWLLPTSSPEDRTSYAWPGVRRTGFAPSPPRPAFMELDLVYRPTFANQQVYFACGGGDATSGLIKFPLGPGDTAGQIARISPPFTQCRSCAPRTCSLTPGAAREAESAQLGWKISKTPMPRLTRRWTWTIAERGRATVREFLSRFHDGHGPQKTI